MITPRQNGFATRELVSLGIAPAERIHVIHHGVAHVLRITPDHTVLTRLGPVDPLWQGLLEAGRTLTARFTWDAATRPSPQRGQSTHICSGCLSREASW